jgi:thymidylate synthase
MHLAADTLDDALNKLYPYILSSDQNVPTSRGMTRELRGVLLEIRKPRARLSRTETRGKSFSCLGELLWYMTKANDLEFITLYIRRYEKESDDGKTVYGGYGPRFFRHRGQDQIANVIELLKKRRNTRRAVVQLFDAEDIGSDHLEIPCTTTLQFMIRNDCLDAIVNMRSNDAFMGLPHDVFCFSMLQ